jgi:hypothetical protein
MGTGTRDVGALDSYEFGEPRLCSRTFGQVGPESAGAGSFPAGEGGHTLSSLEVEGIRRDFPALHQRVNGHPLIWLDNAATTQKPQAVLDATSRFYGRDNSNIHRAAHVLAERSTKHFEAGRERVRQFLGAGDAKEIVFLRGTTEAINLVAQSFGRSKVGPGDEILLTEMEHHANIVPWQLLAQQTGAVIRVAPINHAGELNLDEFAKLLSDRTKIVSVTHVSNALGTINPIEQIVPLARSVGGGGGRGWRPIDAPPSRECPGAGRGLLCVQRAQGVWTDRDRSPLWEGRALRGDAAMARRGAYDPRREF